MDAADSPRYTRVKDLAIDSDIAAAPDAICPPVPPLAAPIRLSFGATASGRRARLGALVLAVIAHMAIVYVLAWAPDKPMLGAGGQEIDAISVTLVSSKALESLDATQPQPDAPVASSSVQTIDGTSDKEPAEAAVERRDDKQREEGREEKKREEEPTRAVEAIFQVSKEAPPKYEKQTAAAPAGGVEARSNAAGDTTASAPAAASAGVARHYAHNVAEALRKTKPRSVGVSGAVRVKFSIELDGSVASVEIGKSSGNPKLDEMAMEAVRRTKFRTPPEGLTSAERFYELPYYFR